jgi:antitoxin component HigA of HigAB toxin-antitoxin module
MTTERIRYPDNLYLRLEVFKSGRKMKDIADSIGVSRELLSNTINGHYKGVNVIPKLKKELGIY